MWKQNGNTVLMSVTTPDVSIPHGFIVSRPLKRRRKLRMLSASLLVSGLLKQADEQLSRRGRRVRHLASMRRYRTAGFNVKMVMIAFDRHRGHK